MRRAKSGQWWEENLHRSLANNSVCYTEKPDFEAFLEEWTSLYESKSGERGIFNRIAAQKQAAKYGKRKGNQPFGVNPCSEILLRPNQVCNLSEIVVRPNDDIISLKEKARVAAIFGTLQSTLTNFRYVRNIWKKNTEEERLLGVSLTGIMDNPILAQDSELLRIWLEELRQTVEKVNAEWAEKLGINPSVATTCVKPSGTVSQLVDCASGIHPRYSEYYIRRVRADAKDTLAQFMAERGFPVEEAIGKPETLVFSFPMKAPKGSVFTKDVGAMEQLKLWKTYQDYWCEHKPSITVYYTDDEFMEVGNWVWNNFDDISGISFLPYSNHVYQQPPYEEITKEEYEKLLLAMPKDVDWEHLQMYEKDDYTTGSQELACVGNSCEL